MSLCSGSRKSGMSTTWFCLSLLSEIVVLANDLHSETRGATCDVQDSLEWVHSTVRMGETLPKKLQDNGTCVRCSSWRINTIFPTRTPWFSRDTARVVKDRKDGRQWQYNCRWDREVHFLKLKITILVCKRWVAEISMVLEDWVRI
jgi:hypothetical protein